MSVGNDGKVQHDAGADFVEDLAFKSSYDPKAAMSALAAFPWPYACVQAISTDLSKVSLKAYRGKGSDAEVLDSHPVLELLHQPSSRVNGVLFRRQIYTDMVLTGNAFILMAGAGNRVDALLRLHPSRVSIAPLSDGQPDRYQYAGSGQPAMYEHDQVLHIRGPSWTDDPTNLWGTGAVQPLHNDLTTEKAQAELAARTAATGQPTGILSPKEEGDRWSREQIRTLRTAYEQQMQSGGSGVLILGGQASFDNLSVSPREMEFSQVRDFVRASTIAAFGCVPVRLGLETANYSQSTNQLQLYWESLQGKAALVDAEFTRIARLMGDADVYIKHDFSEVESLQESRSERLSRVQQWTNLGLAPSDASAYEGFDDVPLTGDDVLIEPVDEPLAPDAEPAAPDAEPAAVDEPLAATALNGAQVSSLLTILEQVAAGLLSEAAAATLIGVAFPTITDEQAAAIVAGAQPLAPDAQEPAAEQIETFAAYDEIDFSVPAGVIEELQRGLEWHEQGLSGDGLTPATVTWATKMAGGDDISPDKAKKMNAWFARHESDKDGQGFNPGEPGYPSAGRVAWALWGGDPAVTWSGKLVQQMLKADEQESEGITKEVDDGVWRAWVDKIQGPAEKAMQQATLAYLKGYAARIGKRLPDVLAKHFGPDDLITKAPGDEVWLDIVLDAFAERKIFDEAIRDVVAESWQRAADAAVAEMPDEVLGEFVYDHSTTDKMIDDQIGSLVKDVEKETKNRVRRVVLVGLEAGDTIASMQAALIKDSGFEAPRALAIARTETARSVNAAGMNAWEQMSDQAGVEVSYKWVASLVGDTRESHAALHGVERGPDGYWYIGDARAKSPGDFGVAKEDINCRCTFAPSVKA